MTRRLQLLLVIVLSLCVASNAVAQNLKYQLKPGETYIYGTTIVADTPDATETSKGTIELKVKSAQAGGMTFTPSSRLSKQVVRRTKGFIPPGPPPFGPPGFVGAPEVTIDSHGKIIRSSGETFLSYLLGTPAELVIEPLSPQGEKKWTRERDLVIREITRSIGFSPFAPRSETNSSAKETATYEISGSSGSEARIKKTYELKTAEQEGDQPRVQLTGTGELVFDSVAGLMKSSEFKGALVFNEKNVQVRVPLTVSYRLMSALEAAAAKKAEEQARAKAIQAAKDAAAPKPISDEEITNALADMKSGNFLTFRNGADRLAKGIPVESRRAEVTQALEGFLKEKDGNHRAEAAKALKTWATIKNLPALIGVLKDENVFATWAAFEALGELKDPKGAEAVAQQVPELRSRLKAVASLKEMGPVAEKAVGGLLKHQEWVVRLEACRILTDIATTESLPALRAAQSDSNRLVSMEAEKAIKAVEGRKR